MEPLACVMVPVQCPVCEGRGTLPCLAEGYACGVCEGAGVVMLEDGEAQETECSARPIRIRKAVAATIGTCALPRARRR